jgi:hypothetical protein
MTSKETEASSKSPSAATSSLWAPPGEGRPQSADSSTAMPLAATLLSDFTESGIARL